jgi:hypothetical protein
VHEAAVPPFTPAQDHVQYPFATVSLLGVTVPEEHTAPDAPLHGAVIDAVALLSDPHAPLVPSVSLQDVVIPVGPVHIQVQFPFEDDSEPAVPNEQRVLELLFQGAVGVGAPLLAAPHVPACPISEQLTVFKGPTQVHSQYPLEP